MRVALSSPDGLFGEALACFIDAHGPYQVVAVEKDARSLLTAVRNREASILVLDGENLRPADVTLVAGAKSLGAFSIIVLTTGDPLAFNGSGADLIVRREDGSAALLKGLTQLAGDDRIDHSLARTGRKPYGSREDGRLSRREFEIAQLVAKGLSNRRIANVTDLREQSVKNLVSVIMRKLDCDNRVQVALKLVHASVDQTSGGD